MKNLKLILSLSVLALFFVLPATSMGQTLKSKQSKEEIMEAKANRKAEIKANKKGEKVKIKGQGQLKKGDAVVKSKGTTVKKKTEFHGKPAAHDKDKDASKAEMLKAKKGNAYGKSKTSSGKHFGQNRAMEAKQKHVDKRNELKVAQGQGKEKFGDAYTRIQNAKAELEKQKKSGKVDAASLQRKEAAIQKAEQRLNELKASIKGGK